MYIYLAFCVYVYVCHTLLQAKRRSTRRSTDTQRTTLEKATEWICMFVTYRHMYT